MMKLKKFFIAVVLVFLVSASQLSGQAFLNGKKYFSVFPVRAGETVSNNDFIWMADQEIYAICAGLSGIADLIDSPLEFALLSYYSPAIISKRPVSANTILPAQNARSAALKLGAAVFKDLTEIRYFDPENLDAVKQHEEMIQFICNKNSLTPALIEQYYRSNIKSLITEVVNDEFNRISFSLSNRAENHIYFITIIRTPQSGRYTMQYEIPAVVTVSKTIAAAARETLMNELRKRADEFSASDIDYIRAQALMIPAVAFKDADITAVVNAVNAFYLNPNTDTHDALTVKWKDLFDQGETGQIAASAFSRALGSLNEILGEIGL